MTTDALLGTVVKTRDEAAFEALFLEYYAGVYRHLFRIVGSQQEAEDLAQDTFLRLYDHRFPAGREHNVRAWLYRVATNLAYNALRSERRRQHREEQATLHRAADDGTADPAQVALRNDERETVRRVLVDLSARETQLLLLRHAGLSYRELAEALDVAPASIGTMLARARSTFEAAYRARVFGGEESDEM